jgi:membrane protein YqaA with SNARE-associated domain
MVRLTAAAPLAVLAVLVLAASSFSTSLLLVVGAAAALAPLQLHRPHPFLRRFNQVLASQYLGRCAAAGP